MEAHKKYFKCFKPNSTPNLLVSIIGSQALLKDLPKMRSLGIPPFIDRGGIEFIIIILELDFMLYTYM